MRIIGQYEQQAIDRLWQQRTGLPLILLMEAAASAVVKTCREIMSVEKSEDAPILILAGKGNNGGDAFACARLLFAAGYQVTCRELFPEADLPPDVEANRHAFLGMGQKAGPLTAEDFSRLVSGSLIIDGVFGTGFRVGRPLPESVCEASRQISDARSRGIHVIAIDVPSGLDADNGRLAIGAIQADITVTFIKNKIGLCAAPGRFFAGRVVVAKIGVPDAWVENVLAGTGQNGSRRDNRLIDAADVRLVCPDRPEDGHKSLFGRVLVLGGATGMPGAVLLAAETAARSGTGLLTIAVPASIGSLVLAALPEGLLNILPEEESGIDIEAEIQTQLTHLLTHQPAVAVGMGAGQAGWLKAVLPLLISQAHHLVIDADALNEIATDPDLYLPMLHMRSQTGLPPAILTPHPGEFRRLMPGIGLQDRQQAASSLSAACASIVVLKGASTVVSIPNGPIWINPTGNNGLAKGGSGDVLAGLTAGLLAQGLPAESAAVAGVYLHGLAADLAAQRLGSRSMLASDVITSIHEAFKTAEWE